MSKEYIVSVREVHIQEVLIEADSPEQAIEKVVKGEGENLDGEYSHTLDSDLWTVEEKESP
jgi:hypothetical protein